MPLHQTTALLVLALAFAGLTALVVPATRRRLTKKPAWGLIGLGAVILSGLSWFVSYERRGGTLLQRIHGWPKPYSGQCLDPECPERSIGFNLLYFLGNSFVYAAGLLLVWTLIAILLSLASRQRSISGP